MDDTVQGIMQKMAGYIEVTQPQLDAIAEHRALRVKRAEQVSSFLVERGLFSKSAQDEFVTRIAQDESGTASFDLVQKLAELVAPVQYGSASSGSAPVGDPQDPWDSRLFPSSSANLIG